MPALKHLALPGENLQSVAFLHMKHGAGDITRETGAGSTTRCFESYSKSQRPNPPSPLTTPNGELPRILLIS